jgi:WD40 repeat protein
VALPGHTGAVSAAAVSPDGRHLATGGSDGTVHLWDIKARMADLVVLRGHDYGVRAAAFSSGGHWLATAGFDKTVRLWDTRAPMDDSVVLRGHAAAVGAVTFSPDERYLVTGSDDGTIRLWRLQVNELIELACNTAGRSLTDQELETFLDSRSYRQTCLSLHSQDEAGTR